MGNLIWWIVVGLIAGWATGKIMKGSGYGAIMDIVLGICGAILGGSLLGLPRDRTSDHRASVPERPPGP